MCVNDVYLVYEVPVSKDLRIYEVGVTEEAEWVVPVDPADFEAVRALACDPIAASWAPVRVRLIREDGGRTFTPTDLPCLGPQGLVMTARALDRLRGTLEPLGEILPLDCADADLWLFHASRCLDVLDEERSEIRRFTSGRIMRVRGYELRLDPPVPHVFKLSAVPAGPLLASQEFVDQVAAAGLFGLRFDQVYPRA